MPYNGSGTFQLPSGNPVVSGTTASATVHNNTNTDLASGLTNCITRDGQSPATANIPMGGFKLTGLAAGAVAGDAVRYEQLSTSLAVKTLVTDETGSGALVFATSPTLVTPLLGTPTSGVLTNCTGLPPTGLSSVTGTGAAVLADSPTLVTPALGTPSALVGTNITGTAAGLSIGGNAATATNATNATNATTSTTQAVGTNSTAIATTAYVMAAEFVDNDVGAGGVGEIAMVRTTGGVLASNSTVAGSTLRVQWWTAGAWGDSQTPSGTWKNISGISTSSTNDVFLAQRIS